MKKINFYWIKLGFLILTDLACVFGVFKISAAMSGQAEEVKKLHSEQVAQKAGDQQMVLQAEVDKFKDRADALASLLPNENNIVNAIISIGQLKTSGTIADFTFVSTSSDPLKDSQGLLGFPISVTITGDINTINNGLSALGKLPYLIKPVVVDVVTGADGVVTAKYGGFIYVDPNYSKN